MTDDLGLRERKKQRTRAAIVAAATRLFDARGYDETTVADIAAAAEISPRTFFSYFPSKEDVLFADMEARIDIARDVIAARRPDDRPVDALLRAVAQVTASGAFADDFGGRTGSLRLKLVMSAPAVQAGALRRLVAAQDAMAESLRSAYADELDETAAAATAGVVCGAMIATAMASLRRGDDLDRMRSEMRRGVEIAVRGIAAPPP
ncbi:MAG: TetR family transcriptional regulator [Stackebrandtia sp.]